ncbi:hypothetical protein TNCV_5025441 [Trichonephila clavipes]|nr:hypothetical protein TNCV_5025441 [Trichonephila clavipes]
MFQRIIGANRVPTPREIYQLMAIISFSHLQVHFSPTSIVAETAPVTTPPRLILPTNQETLFHQGPSTGHILQSRYGVEERFAFHFPVTSSVMGGLKGKSVGKHQTERSCCLFPQK